MASVELTGSWSAWSGRAWWSVVVVVGVCCEGLCHSGPPEAKCVFSFDQWGIYTQGADVRESRAPPASLTTPQPLSTLALCFFHHQKML